MRIAVLMTNTDESDFSNSWPKDGEKDALWSFVQLLGSGNIPLGFAGDHQFLYDHLVQAAKRAAWCLKLHKGAVHSIASAWGALRALRYFALEPRSSARMVGRYTRNVYGSSISCCSSSLHILSTCRRACRNP